MLGALVYKFGRSQVLRTVHAHIEGSVKAVTKTPFGPVELGRAHAEVEQRTGQFAHTEVVQDQAGTVEPPLHYGGPPSKWGERSRRAGHRFCVPVDADDAQMRKGSQQGPGVAAGTDSGVEYHATTDGREDVFYLLDHYGLMLERLFGGARVFSIVLAHGLDRLNIRPVCRAHTQPLGQHRAGFSLSVLRTGRVEKGTPVLLVKGLRISPFEDGGGHFEPPAGWRSGAVCGIGSNSGLVPSMRL